MYDEEFKNDLMEEMMEEEAMEKQEENEESPARELPQRFNIKPRSSRKNRPISRFGSKRRNPKKRDGDEKRTSLPEKKAPKKLKRLKRLKKNSDTKPVNNKSLSKVYIDDRPVINVTELPIYKITDNIVKNHLPNLDEPIFNFGGNLVQVKSDVNNREVIEAISTNKLKGLLDRRIKFAKSLQTGVKTIPPSPELVNDVKAFAVDSKHTKRLLGITNSPIVRCDGTIVTRPGYDNESRYYMTNNEVTASIKVPDQPTGRDIENAKEILSDVLSDFPFSDEASRTNAIGLILSVIIRPAISGLSPMTLVVSSQKGTGKGLFSNLVYMIATGTPAQTVSMVKSDSELRKQITALYREGRPIIVYDNISEIINSPVLASALTSPEWSDRTLGQSKIETYQNRNTFISNGNNVQLGGDLARRCILIDFDPKDSRPWLRNDFKYPNLLAHIKKERANLLSAILTIIRGWYQAGQPSSSVQLLGSYEEWTKVLGGILEWADFDKFLGNMEKLYEESDSESAEFHIFLTAWLNYFGSRKVTAKQICESRIVELVPGEALGKSKGNLPQRVGRMFGSIANTRFGNDGIHIKKAGLKNNTVHWQVITDIDK